VLADSPLAYYRMGEASGTTLVDSSGNAHSGSYAGSPTLGAASLLVSDTVNKAVSFDGVNDIATVGTATWLQQAVFTIEALVSPTSGDTFIGRRNTAVGTNNAWALRLAVDYPSAGQNRLYAILLNTTVGSANLIAASSITLGSTYHVALTYDGTNAKIYVNGALDGTLAIGALNVAAGANFTIGAILNSTSWVNGFAGTVDEVAYYGTALTSTRILAHYNAGVTTGTPTTTGSAPVSVGSSSAVSLVAIGTGTSPVSVGSSSAASIVGTSALTTTGFAPVSVGSSSATTLTVTTAGLSPVGAGSSCAAATVGSLVATGLSPVGVGSSSATSLTIALAGWTADLSQQSFLEITSDTGDLDYTPPAILGTGTESLPPVGALSLPPVGLTERTIMRESITVPAMTPDTDHRVRVNDAVYDAYARTTAVVGVPHVIIGGVDVTYLRGAPITIGTDRQEGPFSDVTFSIDMPQITPQDTPGVGSLSWLVPGATVELVMLNGGVIQRLWAGHLVSDDGGNDATSPRTAWSASGTMWQASTFGHRVPTIMDPTDIGTVIARSLNGVVAHRYPTIAAPKTSINTMARGSSGDSEMAYVQSLLATAWTSTTQWTVAKRANTARTYDIKLKDTTTVHHTVTVGARGVDINLSRDMTSTANALFGRGIAPDGYAWAGWCYPNFMADTAPAYPYASGATVMSVGDTDAGTLTGHGVTDWQWRVCDLNLTGNVPLDGVYNADDASVCRQIQADYGLLVDGVVGPQTWDATFAVGSGGGDLTGAYRRPLAIATETEPNLYTPTGAVKGPNPGYASAMRYERDTDYGPGVTKADATASAVLELARDKNPGLTGTITLLTDPREGSRFLMTPDQNIKPLGYGGADPLLHIAGVDRDWANLTVTLTVDEHARDAITLAAIRFRDKEAMLDPARRPGRTNRRSRQDQDQIVAFDGESDAGILPRHAIYGGLWTVLRIPISEAGDIAKIDVRSESPAAPFSMWFFSGPVTPAHMVSLVGDPLSGTNPSGRTAAAADALDDLGLIEALGGPGSAAGYWPGQEGGTLTGRLKDTGGMKYASAKPPWVWVAEWSPTSTFILGRIYPSPIQ
jgi:hypothetical protein